MSDGSAGEREWPELTVERRFPGLPKIINPSTLHMDTERERYGPIGQRDEELREVLEKEWTVRLADPGRFVGRHEGEDLIDWQKRAFLVIFEEDDGE